MTSSEFSTPDHYGPEAIHSALKSIASRLAGKHANTSDLMILGIANGGIPFARNLAACLSEALNREIPCGQLNIMFHRDDIGSRPIPAPKLSTEFPGEVDGAVVILADDVLFSGRTVRAALNELFDSGRPEKVELAVLFDRGHHKLPIAPDYTGFSQQTDLNHTVKVFLNPEQPQQDYIKVCPK